MKKRYDKRRALWPARAAIFVLGAAAVVFGLWRGEYTEVLQKAVRICLECIGIG